MSGMSENDNTINEIPQERPIEIKTEEKITIQDAKDLLDFAQAICDYVFVLNAKFDRFMERKDSKSKPETKG